MTVTGMNETECVERFNEALDDLMAGLGAKDIKARCNSVLPARLRAIRHHLGMHQEQLADVMAHMIGGPFSRATLTKVEAGKRPLTLPEGIALAKLAGVTVEELTGQDPIKVAIA